MLNMIFVANLAGFGDISLNILVIFAY